MAGLYRRCCPSAVRRCLRHMITMKLLLCIFCVLAIGAAAIPAWLLTYDAGVTAVTSLLHQFQQQVIPMASYAIQSRLTSAQKVVQLTKINFREGLLTNSTYFLKQSFNLVNITEFASSVWFASLSTGCLYGYQRNPVPPRYLCVWLCDPVSHNQTEYYITPDGTASTLQWWAFTNETDALFSQIDGTDPLAVAWSEPYLWHGRLWVTHFTGVYSPSGVYFGQVGADLVLGFLDEVLSSLHLMAGSSVYVVDTKSSQLVASYPSLPLIRCIGSTVVECSGGAMIQVSWEDLGDTVLLEVRNYVEATHGGWMGVSNAVVDLTLSSSRHTAVFTMIEVSNIRWAVVGSISQEVILDPVQQRNKVVLGTVLGVIAGVMVCVVCFTYVVLRPLGGLAKQAGLLSRMSVDQIHVISGSWIREVNVLVRAFNFLVTSLTEVRAYLPAHLFAKRDFAFLQTTEDFEHIAPPNRVGVSMVSIVETPPTPAGGLVGGNNSSNPRVFTTRKVRHDSCASVNSDGSNQQNLPLSKPSNLEDQELPSSLTTSNFPRGRRLSITRDFSVSTNSSGPYNLSSPTTTPPSGVLGLATQLGTSWRAVTVLCVDLCDFQAYVNFHTPSEAAEYYNAYIHVIYECVTYYFGLFDKVMGDRVFAVWNGLQRCSQQELKAVQCALTIEGRLRQCRQQQQQQRQQHGVEEATKATTDGDGRSSSTEFADVSGGVSVSDRRNCETTDLARVGIATSRALCGNLGTEICRTFVVLGDAVSQAVMLQKCVGKLLNAPVVIKEDTVKQVECYVDCFPLAVVKFPDGTHHRCYQPLREFQPRVQEEWMYQLAEKEVGAATSKHVHQIFSLYYTNIAHATPWDIRDKASFSQVDENQLGRKLRTTIEKYPQGIEVKFKP